MLVDYHVHSEFSVDSKYKMKDVVEDAIAIGMQEICFTDHVDYGVKVDWDDPCLREFNKGKIAKRPDRNVNYPVYMKMIKKLQEKYEKLISIKIGMEFGMQVNTIPNYNKLFNKYPFDFIIMSVHEIGNQEFWSQQFQQGKSQKEYNEAYYLEILKLVEVYKDYSVLGHLDVIARYDEQGIYPFKNVAGIIEKILKIVIADGKGIEVNTSSQRYGLKDSTPSRDILKMYKELGGTVLTIGSDSHTPSQLGAYIRETQQELKRLGFSAYCTFDKMQPIFHEIL